MKARIPNQGASSRANMMKQLQDMQNEMARVQTEVEESEFSASSGGGAVEVKVNGKHEVKSIEIKPEVVDPEDIEMLQDLIISGVNEIISEIEEYSTEEMAKVTGGVTMPGLF